MSTTLLSINAPASLGEGWSPLRSEVMLKAGQKKKDTFGTFMKRGSRV
jgi:hypothetical protein